MELISTSTLCETVGMSERQCHYLVRSGVYTPTVMTDGSGTQWRWSKKDLAVMALVAQLRKLGCKGMPLKRAVSKMSKYLAATVDGGGISGEIWVDIHGLLRMSTSGYWVVTHDPDWVDAQWETVADGRSHNL